MSTSRIKQKLSKIIKSQLPAFIQEDYDTFVQFLEAYYRFLEQDQNASEIFQNLKSYNDLDETTPSFVQYFLKTYAPLIPVNTAVDKNLLVKKIKYLYETKGSEASFKLLFKILFNTDVTVDYPNNFTLIPSNGRWEQRVSIQLKTIFGDRTKLLDRFLRYKFEGQIFNIPIVDVKFLTETDTEVFLDPVFIPKDFIIGDSVEVRTNVLNGNIIFIGEVEPIPVIAEVILPGAKFFPGQVYTIGLNQGFGTLIQIIDVDNNFGIKTLRFLRFGQGYDLSVGNVFALPLDPTKNIPGAFASLLNSSIQGFNSSGFVQHLFTDAETYFLEDYVTEIYNMSSREVSFNNSNFKLTKDTFTLPPDAAVVSFRFGSIARYPGEFVTPNGFLSEPVVNLQDSKRFQPFAYQTNTEQDITEFFDVVKSLIHPAGQSLFNNRIVSASFDLSGNVSVEVIQNVYFEALSTFAVSDEVSLTIIIPQNSGNIILVDDKPTFNIFANKFEDIEIVENIEKNINLLKDSDTFIFDQVGVLQNQFSDAFGEFDSIEELDVFKFADPDNVEPIESTVLTPTLFKEDKFNLSSDIDNVTLITNFEDTGIIDDDTSVDSYIEEQDVLETADTNLLNYNTVISDDFSTNSVSNLNITTSLVDSYNLEDTTISDTLIEKVDTIDESDLIEEISILKLVDPDNTTLSENIELESQLDYVDTLQFKSELNITPIINFEDTEQIKDQLDAIDLFLNKQDEIVPIENTLINFSTEFNDIFSLESQSNLNVTALIVDSFQFEDVVLVYFLIERNFEDIQIIEDFSNYNLNIETVENIITNESSNNQVFLNVESDFKLELSTTLIFNAGIVDTQKLIELSSLQHQSNIFNDTILNDQSNSLISLSVNSNLDFESETLLDIEIIITDTQKILEQTSIQYQTTINNSLLPSSDSAAGFLLNYAEDYFEEVYAGELLFNT